MARFFNLPRSRQVLAAIAAVGLVTGSFRLGGLLGTAAQVTAYATAVLAFGTTALAAGAVRTYAEQRTANQQQAGQLAPQKVRDLAQRKIDRVSGPGGRRPAGGGRAGGVPTRDPPGRGGGSEPPRRGPRYGGGHVGGWAASGAGPARGSRAGGGTKPPGCGATAGDGPAASAGEAEAK